MIHYGTKTKEFFFQALKGVARVTRGGVGNLQQKGVEAAGGCYNTKKRRSKWKHRRWGTAHMTDQSQP